MMKKKDSLITPALTVPLALLASCFSMWSNNWHMYGWRHLGACLAALLIFCSIVFLAVFFIHKLHRRRPTSKPADIAAGLGVCVLVVGVLFFLLNAPLSDFIFKTGLNAWAVAAAAVAGLGLLVYFAGFKTLNFFLILWLSTAAASGAYKVATYDGSYKQTVDLRIEMKTRPNIYLFLLESYQGLPVLEEVFGMDTHPMRTFLDDHDFFIYEPVMSNSPHTLGSMAELYTMQLSPIQPSGFISDVMPAVRNAVGGNEDNTLLRILKENGYYTVFLAGAKPMQYFFNFQGQYLDETDAFMLSLYVRPFYDLNPDAFEFLKYKSFANEIPYYQGSLFNRVRLAEELARKKGQPLFVCFKGGADHAPHENYIGTPDSFEQWKPKYRQLMARGDIELKRIVEHIIDVDPDSVIVLIGDHGSQGYHGLFNKQFIAGDVDGFKRIMNEYDISMEQVTDAFFNVLLAVRLPGGPLKDISHDLPMSHVNLFRHILAYLNDAPELLEDREPTRSAYARMILALDNEPACERLDDQ